MVNRLVQTGAVTCNAQTSDDLECLHFIAMNKVAMLLLAIVSGATRVAETSRRKMVLLLLPLWEPV